MARALPLLLLATTALPAQDPTPTPPTPPTPSFAHLARPPRGLPPMPAPVGYEPTAAVFDLGRRLFHDGILSRDRSVTCSSCHPAANGFASPLPRPSGVDGRTAARHAPVLWNRGYGTRQRWDGRSPDLETFVLEPIADPNEMDLPLDSALQRLAADAAYAAEFAAAFGAPPSATTLQRALATFVRGIALGDAPYDRFVAGDAAALTQEQRTGLWVFESKGRCWLCHPPPLFTDEGFHNTGVGVRDGVPEPGHALATGRDDDRGRWKTPTLRGLRWSAPYLHDGSVATIEGVVEFYERGGNANPGLDPRLHAIELSDAERRALAAFLRSL
ncbi:MAG: cytochrome-c peroxidase [Planctomycetes bacterium]|nr:cytochrome-c peroxidase [Planctomycetota bacterium]